ncbi:uncharacterized protein LOC124117416 isoform X3 [Haliotis rufescens]|uniref:uncharacterized protein LOC124117416 isoform X3 n=1 Tax=Haliotis rufescens TaxID=6454 RepID=UPI001EAFE9CF|nr:uncharacterized protein LOC124117416 isoform X3 [Haliotis rufescens]
MARCSAFTLVLLVLLHLYDRSTSANSLEDMAGITTQLLKLVEKLQVKTSTRFIPFVEMQKDKGLYGSDVKLNFHGPPDLAMVRQDMKLFDNNMFVTSWVTMCLLEAFKYGRTHAPSSQQLQMALSAINEYRNKNIPYTNSLMVFWPQVYNDSVQTYQSTPRNLISMYKLMEHLPLGGLEKLLKWLGLANLEHIVEDIMNMEGVFLNAFRIPPDFDDTFVNLGLGSLLTDLKSVFPNEQAQWSHDNTNLSSIFDALKHYAYRPFSNESRVNTIDPRTYFYLRKFLEKASSSGQDVALVPTWIQDIDETRYMYARGDVMPFNINNVDVTVSANTIYGITSAILTGLLHPQILDDQDVQLLYTVGAHLTSSLRGAMTQAILLAGKSQGNTTYFDDFLGDRDMTKDNKTQINGEDRIFTTAMATNALIQTWAVFDETQGKLFWIKETPTSVRETVGKSVQWLINNVLTGQYKPWNAFFSGSSKGHESMPFWYPVNRMEYLNGTKIPNDQHFPSSPWIAGFKGVVSEDRYLEMCRQYHFGQKTPMTFSGYNVGSGYFPFWTSDAYTYASTTLAISQYSNIHVE